jgi:hypothetical protein
MMGDRNRKTPWGSTAALIETRVPTWSGSKRYCSQNPNIGEVMVAAKPRPGSKAVIW